MRRTIHHCFSRRRRPILKPLQEETIPDKLILRRSIMKYLSIALAMLLLASCSTTGTSGGGSMGSSYTSDNTPYSLRTFRPGDLYFGD
jgi:hypothetical protein